MILHYLFAVLENEEKLYQYGYWPEDVHLSQKAVVWIILLEDD